MQIFMPGKKIQLFLLFCVYFHRILKLLEGGFVERWRREHWPTDKCGIKEKYVESRSITLEDLSGNFCTLLLGIVLSVLALSFEITVRKCKLWAANQNGRSLNQSNSSTANMLQFQDMRSQRGSDVTDASKNITKGNGNNSNELNHLKTDSNGLCIKTKDMMSTILRRQASIRDCNGVERSQSGQSMDLKNRNKARLNSVKIVAESQKYDTYPPKSPLELL